MAKKFRELREAAMARGMKLLSIHEIKMPHNDDYAEGFKAGREQGMREAESIVEKYSDGFRHGETADEWQALQEACAAILAAIGEGK